MIYETFREAIQNIWSNKFRTARRRAPRAAASK